MASWFGGKDKKPEVAPEAPKKDASWDDHLDAALPKKAAFFDAMRTEAFVNHNLVENYMEFWAAIKVDPVNDKWRVMHYMIYDLDRADGKFVSEQLTKQDVSFPEAVAQISRAEYTASKLMTHADFDVEKQYPADQYPEMKVHFYDLPHYKNAANIEGIAFDEHGQPYRRIEGKIFANATFKRSDVVSSIIAVEQARNEKAVADKIEGGILSDLFATAADRAASLNNILKIAESLSVMDDFATQVGAFYLAIQKAAKLDEKFDKIEGLTPDEKAAALKRSTQNLPSNVTEANVFDKILNNILPAMNATLQSAKNTGVLVEPFQKFTAECELYTNLLYASHNLAKLERGFVSASNSDTSLITQIRESVDKAQRKFTDLGGTQEQMDKLKAWVATPKKDPIPAWLPGFLTRYYTSRGNVMKKVQERKAGVAQVKTLSADVKPPVADAFNGNAALSQPATPTDKPVAQPAANDGTQGADFDKFKNIMGVNGAKKPGVNP